MALNLNIGYGFKAPAIPDLQGSVLLAVSMPMHQLQRRKIDKRYPHLATYVFDPQLYLAGLDAYQALDSCIKLATYPWFGVETEEYSSDEQSQSEWKKNAETYLATHWRRVPPSDPKEVDDAAREAVDFQVRLGCKFIILPSPLTQDPSSEYDLELLWLDSGIKHAKRLAGDLPIYATVALQDLCLRAFEPTRSPLLSLIADAVTARGVDGVYLVVEQGLESNDGRQCGSTRTLHSVLHLVHLLSQLGGIKVFVNSLGAFGLPCLAAGASEWATGWYKSLYRVRLADHIGEGRSFPTYWSTQAASDIHLDSDFDLLVKKGFLPKIATKTGASSGLLAAAQAGQLVARVPDWAYRQTNIASASEHFLSTMASFSQMLESLEMPHRIAYVQQWLNEAASLAAQLKSTLGRTGKTKLDHPAAWAEAFSLYRRDHSL